MSGRRSGAVRPRRTNLPIQLTSFVGRELEISEVKHLLASSLMLTLTGAGGMGKTRLALHVATDVRDTFADGVWLVELAPITDPRLVPASVAAALGLGEEVGRSLLSTLISFLSGKQALILLDNCEHLLDACAQLADTLLQHCPRLSILATSRERLHVSGEAVWHVPALSLPSKWHLPSLTELEQYEAVLLFVTRARAADPSFTLNSRNAEAVAQICRRLDGIPLAIELAAAQARDLSAEQILTRLDDRFRLLQGEPDAPLRQRTLLTLLDWSYDHLPPAEQAVLQRLSVFAGGATAEAAAAVCADDEIDGLAALDLLSVLVNKSLVVEEQEDETRYSLLETIREYALAKLTASGELERTRLRHAEYYLATLEYAEGLFRKGQHEDWLPRIEREHDNIRAVLRWALADDGANVEYAYRMSGALARFWHGHGHISEGRAWMTAALAHPEHGSVMGRAKALNTAGALAMHQSDYPAARDLYQQSVEMRRQLGDKWEIAQSLNNLACAAIEVGDFGAARTLLDECLELGEEIGNKGIIAAAYTNLGEVAMSQGEYADGSRLLNNALTIARELGNRYNMVAILGNLGALARYQHDYPQALALHQESLNLARELEDKPNIAYALYNLAGVASDNHDYHTARTLGKQSLTMLLELGDKRRVAEGLELLAALDATAGQARRATRLFGAASGLRQSIGAPLPAVDQPAYQRSLAATRAQLSDAAFAKAWAEGEAMSLEDATKYALERVAGS